MPTFMPRVRRPLHRAQVRSHVLNSLPADQAAQPGGDWDIDELPMLQGAMQAEVVRQLDARTLMFSGEVCRESADEFIIKLRTLEQDLLAQYGLVRSQVPDYAPSIRIEISSPGGDVHEGLRMLDAITTARIPVETVASGLVASMGIHLLLAGDRRLAYPSSYLMIHDVFAGKAGTLSHMRSHARYLERLQDDLNRKILDNTDLTERELARLSAEEFWFGAHEAVQIGLVDAIVSPADSLTLL